MAQSGFTHLLGATHTKTYLIVTLTHEVSDSSILQIRKVDSKEISNLLKVISAKGDSRLHMPISAIQLVSGAGREESQGWWEGWLLKGWKTQDPYTRAAL